MWNTHLSSTFERYLLQQTRFVLKTPTTFKSGIVWRVSVCLSMGKAHRHRSKAHRLSFLMVAFSWFPVLGLIAKNNAGCSDGQEA